LAIFGGLAQGGLFALSCKLVDWLRPHDREDEDQQKVADDEETELTQANQVN